MIPWWYAVSSFVLGLFLGVLYAYLLVRSLRATWRRRNAEVIDLIGRKPKRGSTE